MLCCPPLQPAYESATRAQRLSDAIINIPMARQLLLEASFQCSEGHRLWAWAMAGLSRSSQMGGSKPAWTRVSSDTDGLRWSGVSKAPPRLLCTPLALGTRAVRCRHPSWGWGRSGPGGRSFEAEAQDPAMHQVSLEVIRPKGDGARRSEC